MTFTFRCGACRSTTEVQQRIGRSPAPPARCACGGEWQRVFAPLAVVYRCSGFYQTDKVLYQKDDYDTYGY